MTPSTQRLHGRGDPRDVGPDGDGITGAGAHRGRRGQRGRRREEGGARVGRAIAQGHRAGDGVVVATWRWLSIFGETWRTS